jgi:estrone sulfotransferase
MKKFQKAIRYPQGVIGLNKRDIILSSYPRSGSTWIRFLLCNLISLLEWDGKTVDFPLLNRTMVEFGTNNLLEPWTHSTIPRVVKTHKRYLPILGRASGAIGIIRDPRDVMVSNYHFRRDRERTYSDSFDEFVRNRRFGLEAWFRHYLSWRDHWTLVVRYEDLREDTFREFNRVLDMLGVNCPEDIVREVISRSRIERVREIEKPSSISDREEARFARDGRTGQWAAYFSEPNRAYYDELLVRYKVCLR